MTEHTLHLGDCVEVLRTMPDASVDAVVTDPPYGLAFMGKRWDYDVPSVEVWAECLRVLKPGGHLLAFAGTRTQHRMAVRIEDAGFEIRDMIAWVYGSGFPKSLDVSKAIDKHGGQSVAWFGPWFRNWREAQGINQKQVAALFPSKTGNLTGCVANWELGFNMPTPEQFNLIRDTFGLPFESIQAAKREVVGQHETDMGGLGGERLGQKGGDITAPATPEAQQWAGWGTALKPSIETVTWATKPFPPQGERAKILGNLWKIEARLWLLSSASAAAQNSTSSQSEYGAACATAQWTADDATNTRAALRGLMDTWQCEMATHMSLSIVSSWRRTLEESSKPGSTSTTETESRTTIDWKTLSCCLSQITPESIIQACSLPGGFSVNASTAAQIFNASLASLQSTLTLSAIEPATWRALDDSQGEAVRPNLDPVVMARKPFKGTVAANVLEHGTGALNVDGCRVSGPPSGLKPYTRSTTPPMGGDKSIRACAVAGRDVNYTDHPSGRWPANLIHDGSDEVVGLFPQVSGQVGMQKDQGGFRFIAGDTESRQSFTRGTVDSGSAARFFYTAKANRAERQGVTHPTVKPLDLMAYLCRLVTPPGGIVLDPFMGSGTTIKAALSEGFQAIGIERDPAYFEMAQHRMNGAQLGLPLANAAPS